MAYTAYISIKGQKQGQFAGDGSDPKNPNRIRTTSFAFSAEAPRDVATGQASGKRQYQPVIVRKRWGEASPQVYAALATNEVLPSVLVEFTDVSVKGIEEVDHSFSLTNAIISAVKELTESAQSANQVEEFEEISFTFQKIEIKDKSGKSFVDNWLALA